MRYYKAMGWGLQIMVGTKQVGVCVGSSEACAMLLGLSIRQRRGLRKHGLCAA